VGGRGSKRKKEVLMAPMKKGDLWDRRKTEGRRDELSRKSGDGTGRNWEEEICTEVGHCWPATLIPPEGRVPARKQKKGSSEWFFKGEGGEAA